MIFTQKWISDMFSYKKAKAECAKQPICTKSLFLIMSFGILFSNDMIFIIFFLL